MRLPTDTPHLRLPTRQYELFGKPMGQGIQRRKIWVSTAFAAVWWSLLLLVGITPLDRLGPMVWLVPVGVVTVLGARTGEDGRMALMRAYDWMLARLPRRRRVVRNPLIATVHRSPTPIRITAHTHVQATKEQS